MVLCQWEGVRVCVAYCSGTDPPPPPPPKVLPSAFCSGFSYFLILEAAMEQLFSWKNTENNSCCHHDRRVVSRYFYFRLFFLKKIGSIPSLNAVMFVIIYPKLYPEVECPLTLWECVCLLKLSLSWGPFKCYVTHFYCEILLLSNWTRNDCFIAMNA